MRMYKWFMSIILAGSLIGMVGCNNEATKQTAKEDVSADVNHQNHGDEQAKQSPQKEEPKEIVVDVVDPNTKMIIKTFHPKEMGFETNREKYKQEIEKWAKDTARGTEISSGYDQRMVLDKIAANGEIIKGKPMIILEEEELVEKIMNASVSGGTVELPLYVTQSGYKPEDVHLLGEVVVASYTTYFNPNVTGRNKNIELSANAINNVIVGVNDHFSFNTTVGPSDAAHGYQKAMEAVNGKLVEGIGGGICQTSSTLFNAVDKLGVTYIERHHHSVNVGYVPKGRDATVSYGGVDFRFQNTTGAPFLIKAYTNKGSITVEVRTAKKYASLMKR